MFGLHLTGLDDFLIHETNCPPPPQGCKSISLSTLAIIVPEVLLQG